MCDWINVKDSLPNRSHGGRHAILHVEGDIYPLLLWDSYNKEVGEVHIGGFENGKFYVDDDKVEESQLNITHWASIKLQKRKNNDSKI